MLLELAKVAAAGVALEKLRLDDDALALADADSDAAAEQALTIGSRRVRIVVRAVTHSVVAGRQPEVEQTGQLRRQRAARAGQHVVGQRFFVGILNVACEARLDPEALTE